MASQLLRRAASCAPMTFEIVRTRSHARLSSAAPPPGFGDMVKVEAIFATVPATGVPAIGTTGIAALLLLSRAGGLVDPASPLGPGWARVTRSIRGAEGGTAPRVDRAHEVRAATHPLFLQDLRPRPARGGHETALGVGRAVSGARKDRE